jgi:hypothetical protein
VIGAGGPALTDWLQAAGGIGGAITAVVLAVLAYKQMRASRKQAGAAAEQVSLMRSEGDEERRHRAAESARRFEEQEVRDQAVRDQLAALSDITDATRDAARAQLQPIVFAHAYGAAVRGPDDTLDLGDGDVGFPYYIANEGTGPALDVKHGVEVEGIDHPFGGGMGYRTLRPEESAPPLDQTTGKLVVIRPLMVVLREEDLLPGWPTAVGTYWARFENVFGEQFETRNPTDPLQSAAFMRTTELPSPE